MNTYKHFFFTSVFQKNLNSLWNSPAGEIMNPDIDGSIEKKQFSMRGDPL